jgi:hypothetical protein
MAAISTWTSEDTQTARRIWQEYQKTHDLTDRVGKAAGIDPKTGEVWLGESALDIVRQRKEKGFDSPLFFERVGSATYLRKGGRR